MISSVVSYGDLAFGEGALWAWLIDGKRLSLPEISVELANRIGRAPILASVSRESGTIPVLVILDDADLESLRSQLLAGCDPDDETAKKLTITDANHGPRYKYAICTSCAPIKRGGRVVKHVYLATFNVSGDNRWRSRDIVTEAAWSVTASGQTVTVDNQGDCDAFPIVGVTPTAGKASAAYTKESWIPIFWPADESAANYPTDITDGGLDLSATAQADGDDIQVYVDGVAVDRWLGGTLVTDVKVWVNLDFAMHASVGLKTALDNATEYTEVEADGDISDFPVSDGIFMIESEAFTYTQRNLAQQKFEGVQRAVKGTSKAAHTTARTIEWVQHDLWLRYGDATATAPTVNDDYKPIFNLSTSTNTSWVYANFGETGKPRAGAFWEFVNDFGMRKYTGNKTSDANPWTELGLSAESDEAHGWWLYHHPCEITGASFQNGEKRIIGTHYDYWACSIYSYNDYLGHPYGIQEKWIAAPDPILLLAPTEAGDNNNQLSDWANLRWPYAADLFVNIVDDGGGDYHVDLYDDADKIVELGDLNTQLSDWDQVLGLNDANTDDGKIYGVITDDDGGTNYHVDLYDSKNNSGQAGVEVVGTTQLGGLSNILGLTTLNTDGWWISPRIIDEGGGNFRVDIYRGTRSLEETGDDNNQLSGWGGVTGIAAHNLTGARKLYAYLVNEGGGSYRVTLWRGDGPSRSGEIAQVYRITGVNLQNSDQGKLYCTAYYNQIWFYKDAGKDSADLVAKTSTYSSPGLVAVNEENDSGIGGQIFTNEVIDHDAWADLGRLVGHTESYSGTGDKTIHSDFESDLGGTITVDAVTVEDLDIEIYFGERIAHTGTYTGKGAVSLYQNEDSGIGGSISILTNSPAADDSIQVFVPLRKRIAYTAGYNAGGSKTLTPDNGSGVHGRITVDAVTAADIYIEIDYSNRVGHTDPYSTTGAKAVIGDFGSGMGGSLTIDAVTAVDTNITVTFEVWENWSDVDALVNSDVYWLRLRFNPGWVDDGTGHDWDPDVDKAEVEVSDVTITLDSGETPDITVLAAATPYALDATITNETTDEAITLETGISIDQELEVDTDEKTVVYQADNTNMRGALSKDGVRKNWLALQPGVNTIKYEETGVAGVTVAISYRKRWRD